VLGLDVTDGPRCPVRATRRRAGRRAIFEDAVLLHEATPGDTTYASWAIREWAWFSASGMLTGSHLVADGLSPRCRPKLSSPAWTYNQGMLIGALVSLATMTGRRSFLVTAGKVAHAVMRSATQAAASPRPA
jgi:predicted alpha-1,6-mannanase (GH76 family)